MHSNGPFNEQAVLDHFYTALVCYSDPQFNNFFIGVTFPIEFRNIILKMK